MLWETDGCRGRGKEKKDIVGEEKRGEEGQERRGEERGGEEGRGEGNGLDWSG